jgi:4-hydroxybenzoate polyprenyltransferase
MGTSRNTKHGPPASVGIAARTGMRRLISGPPATPGVRQPGPLSVAWALVCVARPEQWVKNLACFAGLIFSGRLFLARAEVEAFAAFWSFCFASSSVYILNDYFDRENDRRNPRTDSRPLASGTLPLGAAAAAFVVLVGAAAAISVALGAACLVVLLAYFAMNVAYSTRLKRAVIADVMCIALGFVLRMLHGIFAIGVEPTAWIVLCMFFLAMFLGFAKRRGELNQLSTHSGEARLVLKKYSAPYLDTLLTISATLAILCYALFTVVSHQNPTLIVTIVPVVYCILRYLLQVVMHGQGESPDVMLVSDWRLWAAIACWVAAYVAVVYGDIHLFVCAPVGVGLTGVV